jgi:type I restriction enzyme S subunit
VPLKRISQLITERAEQTTRPIALEHIESWTGRLHPTDSSFESDGVAFKPGDILFGKLRPYLAKVYLSDDAGEAIGDFFVIRPGRISAPFLHRYLLNPVVIQEINASTIGAKMPRASWEDMGTLPVTVPSKDEQTLIINFLNHETAKIDALVDEQKRLIALLKEKRQAVISHAVTKGLDPNAPMKDSGLEWIGRVPAHWSVARVSALFDEVFEAGSSQLPVLQVSIHSGVSDRELSEDEYDKKTARIEDREKYKRVRPGDLTYNMMRAWQGAFGAVTVDGQVSPAYVVARPSQPDLSPFIERQLRSPCGITEMRRYSYGVADFRMRLYWEHFKTLRIAVPPLAERKAIMNRITRWTESVRQLEDGACQGSCRLKFHAAT